MTPEEKLQTIELIKAHVIEHGNCRVGWAIMEVIGNSGLGMHNKAKIANTLIQDTRFIKEATRNHNQDPDIDILLNPAFESQQKNDQLTESNIQANINQRRWAWFNAVFTIINLVILIWQLFQDQ